jgi:hypothetical protein
LQSPLHAPDLVLNHRQALGRQAAGPGLPEVDLNQPFDGGQWLRSS